MDYNKLYDGAGAQGLKEKFLDPEAYYTDGDPYGRGFEEAMKAASTVFKLNTSSTKLNEDSLVKVLIKIYNQRLNKEKAFLKEWERFTGIERKGKVKIPMNGGENYKLSVSKEYAHQFSDFLIEAIGKGDEIVECLRSDRLAEEMEGLTSQLYSTEAAKRGKGVKKKLGQSDLNRFYEQLFNLFFNLKNGNSAGTPISLDDMLKNGYNVGSKVFEKKFKKFCSQYYSELSVEGGFLDKAFKGMDSVVGKEITEAVYQAFNANTPKTFIFGKNGNIEGRGVSYETEQQLKKMFLQTLRKLADRTQTDYRDISIPGVLEINPYWKEANDKYHLTVQVQVDKLAEERKRLKELKQKNSKAVDFRNYNTTYIINSESNEKDQVLDKSTGKPIQLKQLFLNYLYTKMENILNRTLTRKEKDQLSQAAFQKINDTIKRADEALSIMTIVGPWGMKGFLGELATAYSLKNLQNRIGKKVTTDMTGTARAGVSGQLHFDVAAVINGMHIGFQVKNYNTENSKETTLYKTSVGFGTKEMYKYLGADAQKYKWLFANGIFITKTVDKMQDMREMMEKSLLNYTTNFLRITDPSIPENSIYSNIESDVYVVGPYYFPSSYLIACAIDRIKKQLKNNKNKLFTISGPFPKYRRKKAPYSRQNKKTGEWHTVYESEGSKYNLVDITQGASTRVFTSDDEILFSGITIKFTI